MNSLNGFFKKYAFHTNQLMDLMIKHKINSALLSHVYKMSQTGIITSLFAATLLLIGLLPNQNAFVLLGWYGIFVSITLFRFFLVQAYLKQPFPEKNIIMWRRLFIIGATLAGLSWGIPGSVFLQSASSSQLILTVLILAGVTAGSIPIFSGILEAATIFIVLVVGQLILGLVLLGDETAFLFSIGAVVYSGYLILLAIKNRNLIISAISLQFDNNVLLHNLADAKDQLEVINKKLEHAATHDSLTNLANRSLFELTFNEAIQRAEKDQKILALLYLDVDKFKEVNDVYGHHIGDQLLQQIVERLNQKLPENAMASRLGGDEITVIWENVMQPETIEKLGQQLCTLMAKPFEIKEFLIKSSISIGISVFPFDGRNLEILLKNADKAMYFVKNHGGNNYHFNTSLPIIMTSLLNSLSTSEKHVI